MKKAPTRSLRTFRACATSTATKAWLSAWTPQHQRPALLLLSKTYIVRRGVKGSFGSPFTWSIALLTNWSIQNLRPMFCGSSLSMTSIIFRADSSVTANKIACLRSSVETRDHLRLGRHYLDRPAFSYLLQTVNRTLLFAANCCASIRNPRGTCRLGGVPLKRSSSLPNS
jgi:hypothetical protein